jgi:hypothetical protein
MRRAFLPVLAATALVPALLAFAEEAPKEAPKPPTTPLPAFENPLWDAKPGETLLYKVRELEGKWTRYYEERVLARVKDQVLIETILTDETGTKDWGRDPDPRNTGWREVTQEMKLGPTQKWVKERQKEEVLLVGEPTPRAAVRCTRRVIDEPEDFSKPDGKRRPREIWYSHDVPGTGRVKMFPAQQNGERMAISWDKVLPADVREKRAALIPMPKKEEPGMGEPGMGDPAMGEPGMEEPGMKEPGMEEPGKEPGMEEPGMDEPPKDGK